MVIAAVLLITYKEWIGKMIAVCLLWAAFEMYRARQKRIRDKYDKLKVYTGFDQTVVQSIVSAQHGLRAAQEMLQTANITILKFLSIVTWRAEKHARMVMIVMIGLGILMALVPFKLLVISATLCMFAMTSKLGKAIKNERGDRRMRVVGFHPHHSCRNQ